MGWGGIGDNWNTGDNWDPNGVPGNTDTANITGNTLATAAVLNDAQTVNDVFVGSAGAGFLYITTGANLSTLDSNENDGLRVGNGTGTGTVTMDGGTVGLTGGFQIGRDGASTGTFNISGGILTAGQPIWIGRGGTGTVNQSNGSVSTSNSGDSVRIGSLAGSHGTYNISGGSLNAGRYLNLGRTDGTTTAALLMSGSSTVNLGMSSEGGARIRSGGFLEMDGSGSLLTMSGHFELEGGTFSALIDNAAVADPNTWKTIEALDVEFLSGSKLNLGFSTGTSPADGTWRLLEWSRNVQGTPVLELADGVSSGWTFNLDTDNKFLDVTYLVPEPSSLILILSGILLLAAQRMTRIHSF